MGEEDWRDRSRSVSHFELLDAFHEEGCPVCRLLLKWGRSYLDSLFYEYVNDVGIRCRLRESHGFCNPHAWMAVAIDHSQSGVAIIYEHLLNDQIGAFQRLLHSIRPRFWWGRLKAKWLRLDREPPLFALRSRTSPCPACERLDRFLEPDLTDTLLSCLSDPKFTDGFRASFGLCLPHLHNALVTGKDHPNLPVLVDLQLQKFRALRGELGEYIRKLDYRFMAEPRGDEKTAWRRAIELFVGKPEVFGPDRGTWEMGENRNAGSAPRMPMRGWALEPDTSCDDDAKRLRNDPLSQPEGEGS